MEEMGMTYKIEYRKIDTPGGKMRLLILRPKNASAKVPGVLWIHGGGYATGMPEMVFMSRAKDLAKMGAVVVSPDYRLSWKAPYPAAFDDCYESLLWLKDHTDELGVDDSRIYVGGESAGGGLAAAVCLAARDRGDVKIAYQMPLYPMLDCIDTDSSRDNHGLGWNTKRNHSAWKLYLKGLSCSADEVPYTASPSRCEDYHDLPPAYTFVCEGEPFLDETLTYVKNLKDAGIKAVCKVYPGNMHAFDMTLPWTQVSKDAARDFRKAYRYAEKHFRT